MGGVELLAGKFLPGAGKLFLFTCFGFILGRMALKTVVHSGGFILRGIREFDWTDVSEATAVSGLLKMKCRNGGAAALPRFVIEDPKFEAAIHDWLASDHPVRRALEKSATHPVADDDLRS